MGKRSDFKRMKGDYYITPKDAVIPLIPFLKPGTAFSEPCAGNGALIDALEAHGFCCVWASDIDPKRADIMKRDVLGENENLPLSFGGQIYITNPPWTRDILHQIILKLSAQKPTWLLFDAGWAHTQQAIPYQQYCRKIVSVDHVSLMRNNINSKDDAAWYLFDQTGEYEQQISEFHFKAAP